jgi:hypothetical protein
MPQSTRVWGTTGLRVLPTNLQESSTYLSVWSRHLPASFKRDAGSYKDDGPGHGSGRRNVTRMTENGEHAFALQSKFSSVQWMHLSQFRNYPTPACWQFQFIRQNGRRFTVLTPKDLKHCSNGIAKGLGHEKNSFFLFLSCVWRNKLQFWPERLLSSKKRGQNVSLTKPLSSSTV